MKKVFLLPITLSFLGACAHHEPEPIYTYEPEIKRENPDADAIRYRENIAVKASGKDFVIYEYKDVRIDELASLAINYCDKNTNGKKAYLREIVMNYDSGRRATFDCIDLQ